MLLKPAEYVVHVLDGVRPAARALGYSPSAISNWRKSGEVPTRARKIILDYARKKELDINAHDLQHGRRLRRLTDMRR